MKRAELLWVLPLALALLSVAQAQLAGNLEVPYFNAATALNSDVPKPPVAKGGRTQAAALFSGAEVGPKLANSAGLDDDVLAAYRAIESAMARIHASPKCQKFFHNEGEQKLANTLYSLQYLKVPSIAAQVDGMVVLLNRSPNGMFMKPPEALAGLTGPAQIREFFILHELAHELSRFTRYLVDHTASSRANAFRIQLNNELLFANCYMDSRSLTAQR